MTPKTMSQAILDEIQALTPDIPKKDINELLGMVESGDASQMMKVMKILTDHKLAHRLNKPQIAGLIKFFESLSPLVNLLGLVAKL